MKKTIACATAVAVGAVLLTGCTTEKAKEPFRDAPQGPRNSSPAAIAEFPDGYSNMSHKCIAPGIRGGVGFRNDDNRVAIAMVADPNCK